MLKCRNTLSFERFALPCESLPSLAGEDGIDAHRAAQTPFPIDANAAPTTPQLAARASQRIAVEYVVTMIPSYVTKLSALA